MLPTQVKQKLEEIKLKSIITGAPLNWKLHIWNMESIGWLICYSYNEDQFGVVQRDLKELLNLLIDVAMAWSQLIRLLEGVGGSEINDHAFVAITSGMNFAAMDSMRRIFTSFGKHME